MIAILFQWISIGRERILVGDRNFALPMFAIDLQQIAEAKQSWSITLSSIGNNLHVEILLFSQ